MSGRRKVTASTDTSEGPHQAGGPAPASSSDEERREFIKIAVVASAVIATGGLGALVKSVTNPAQSQENPGTASFPRVKVANIGDLQVNTPISFFYPLDNEPNLLVKTGRSVQNGVGPDGDIVAYSQLCQHLGCVYGYQSPGTPPKCNNSYSPDVPVGYCCCHGTVFDFTQDGKVLSGPSPRPLPRVILEVSGSEIFAVGMTPPTIFGHQTGSNDVSADLEGGNLVS